MSSGRVPESAGSSEAPEQGLGVQPPNFSWVLPGRLAGLALPRLPAHYRFLLAQGVRHLVSLTERGPPHGDCCPGLTLHRLRIADFCPPAPEQIDRFVHIVDEANARGEMRALRLREMAGLPGASHCAKELAANPSGSSTRCFLDQTPHLPRPAPGSSDMGKSTFIKA
ncbi:dual specificity protein phosphatase 23 isoform X2 [Pipistrellus kuhlii]|uniref:dual specificity protein phosphatase 23 isoform X2 n=1 Tax=Pipistrellus kuhlii TaxID=59472 RepID=UPI00174EDDBF|nr:dual specificity protein phosphatase 23 isoform X2 [Pipistrellus kuhlii]